MALRQLHRYRYAIASLNQRDLEQQGFSSASELLRSATSVQELHALLKETLFGE